MKLTPQIVRSFMLLRHPDFSSLRDWIEGERNEALERMASVRDVESWRADQGRAKVLKEILEMVDSSDTLMEKLNLNRK
jgi:hypothetical protein